MKNIRILLDKESGKPKGFAFVEYFDTNTALSAIRHLDQTELNSRKIKVGYPAQSNLKDVARQIGQVVPESSADVGNMAIGGSSSAATRIQIEQSVINSLKLHEAWDILEAMTKLVSEDNNRGQKAKGILQTHPQLINAVYEIQKKLGIPLPKHIQQQQLTNITNLTSDLSSNVVNPSIIGVEGMSSSTASRFSSQQQLFPGDVRTLAASGGSNIIVGNIKATSTRSSSHQQNVLHEHPYAPAPSHLTSSFQTTNQPPQTAAIPVFRHTRQYATNQYLPPPVPQDNMMGGGYTATHQGYSDIAEQAQFNPYLATVGSGGDMIINNQQQQYNTNASSFEMQIPIDPNMMFQQQQHQQQQGIHSIERRSRFSSNNNNIITNDPNSINNQFSSVGGSGSIMNTINIGTNSSSEEEFNASMESYLMGGRPPPNMLMHHNPHQ